MTRPWHATREATTVHTSAGSLDALEWDAICGRNPFAEHRWLCLLETVRLNYRPIYIEIRDGDRLVAGAVCRPQSDFHASESGAMPAARSVVEGIAKRRPPLTCALAGLMQSGLVIPDDEAGSIHVAAVVEAMRAVSRSEGSLFVALSDLDDREVEALAQAGIHSTRSLPPETCVAIGSTTFEEFLDALPRKNRTKIRRYRRRAQEHGISVRFGSLEELGGADYERLVRQVEHRHGNDYPYVAGFTASAGRQLRADEHRTIVARLHGEIVACATVLRSGSTAVVKWVGLDYERSSETYAYHLLMTECVHAAMELGAKELCLGPTTYPIKRQVGAELVARHVVVTGRRPLTGSLINQVVSRLRQ